MVLQPMQIITFCAYLLGLFCVVYVSWDSQKCHSYSSCKNYIETMASLMDYAVQVENGFGVLESECSEVGYGGYETSDEGGFETVRRKRKRRNTSGAQTQAHVRSFDSASSDGKLAMMFEDLQILKNGQKAMQKGMSTITTSIATTCQKVDEVINATNTNVDLLKLLSYKSIDIEARSRRCNIIIRGLPEERDENCFQVARAFICDHLGLDANRMFLVRAHRLGARRRGLRQFEPQKRPLIVAFRDYTDTVMILDNTRRLKDSPYSVDRDQPREIYEARKRLWPILKEKRREHPRSDVYIQYPAKLMVDKTVIRDEFPDWFSVLRGKRDVTISHVEPFMKHPVQQASSVFPNIPQTTSDNDNQTTRYNTTHLSDSMNERTFHSNNFVSREINISPQTGQLIISTQENVPLTKQNSMSEIRQSGPITTTTLTQQPVQPLSTVVQTMTHETPVPSAACGTLVHRPAWTVSSTLTSAADKSTSVSETSNVPSSVSETSNVPSSVNETSNVPSSVSETSNVPLSVSVASNVPSSVCKTSNVFSSVSETSNVPTSVSETSKVPSSVSKTSNKPLASTPTTRSTVTSANPSPHNVSVQNDVQLHSTLSPNASSFTPACQTLFSRKKASDNPDKSQDSNHGEPMDTTDNGKRSAVLKQSSFKLPPHIEQSIFRSPVNVPSRSSSVVRDYCSINLPVNELSGGGSKQKQNHVSRSRSVTRKSPGNRRKSSNSTSRRRGQGSTDLNSEPTQVNTNNDTSK